MIEHHGPWSRPRRLAVAVIAVVATIAACHSDSTSATTVRTLRVVSGDSQSVVVGGHPLATVLTAQVLSPDGVPEAGDSVSWIVTFGGGVVSAQREVSDVDGKVTAMFVSGTSAQNAFVSAAIGNKSANFTIHQLAGPLTGLAAATGNGSAAAVGQGVKLTARAVDAFGNGIGGVSIGWVTSGGMLRDASSVTDSTGNAVNFITLGPAPGRVTVTASSTGLASVFFLVDGV